MIERTNPLPVGRYWQDIFDPYIDEFHAWLNANSESVFVETTQTFKGSDQSAHEAGIDQPRDREFLIFRVIKPVDWNQQHWGFPTVALKSITSSSDTVSRPALPLDVSTQLYDAIPTAKSVMSTLITLGAAAVAVVILIKVMSMKRPSR